MPSGSMVNVFSRCLWTIVSSYIMSCAPAANSGCAYLQQRYETSLMHMQWLHAFAASARLLDCLLSCPQASMMQVSTIAIENERAPGRSVSAVVMS